MYISFDASIKYTNGLTKKFRKLCFYNYAGVYGCLLRYYRGYYTDHNKQWQILYMNSQSKCYGLFTADYYIVYFEVKGFIVYWVH